MTTTINWTSSAPTPPLIAVGEIDTHGYFYVDSLFHHMHNAERFARDLLARGAFRVAIDGIVFQRSRLAQQMDAQERMAA